MFRWATVSATSERPVAALADIRRRYQRDKATPRAAGVHLSAGGCRPAGGVLRGQEGHAARGVGRTHLRRFVMCYPPGTRSSRPVSRITRDILDYIRYAKEKELHALLGTEDPEVNSLRSFAAL